MSKRTILIGSFVFLLLAAIYFLTLHYPESGKAIGLSRRSPGVSLEKIARAAVTDPLNFTKKQVQGGIGITLVPLSPAGPPAIGSILLESPAHRAGLLEGDVILKVNGVLATNKPSAQVASEIKGITAGFVTLTVQRGGSNCDYTIQRSSWNSLEQRNLP